MALIRKYNTGGSFKDYVNEKLIKGGLTNKSYQYINIQVLVIKVI